MNEHPQTANPGVDGDDLVALIHLMVNQIVNPILGQFVHVFQLQNPSDAAQILAIIAVINMDGSTRVVKI